MEWFLYALKHLFLDVGQAVQSLIQGSIQLCKVQTDNVIYILAEEGAAGHCADTYLTSHFLTELHIGLTLLQVGRDVSQHEVCALRIGVGNAGLLL